MKPRLKAEDMRVDVYRTGIQSPVAVRVTHLPTGEFADAVRPTRLQAQAEAMRLLRLKAGLR